MTRTNDVLKYNGETPRNILVRFKQNIYGSPPIALLPNGAVFEFVFDNQAGI
jgi:hypothetical protein